MRDRPIPLAAWHRPGWANKSNSYAAGASIKHTRIGGRVSVGMGPALVVSLVVVDNVMTSGSLVRVTRKSPRIALGNIRLTLPMARQLATILIELHDLVVPPPPARPSDLAVVFEGAAQ